MKELLPLLTAIVAVAGTLAGVFINNISTRRRDMSKFKREMLEEIFKTANEMHYLLIRDESEFETAKRIMEFEHPGGLTIQQQDELDKVRELQIKVHNELSELHAKFDMLVSFYFDKLVSPAYAFSRECDKFLFYRYQDVTPRRKEPSTPIDLNDKKKIFLSHVKVEVKRMWL